MAPLNLYRLLIAGAFCVYCLTTCNGGESKTTYSGAIFTDSNTVFLPPELLDNNGEPFRTFTVTINDKAIIDDLLNQFISTREVKMEKERKTEPSGIPLRQSIRQIIPAYDSANNKIIWVNCRCRTEPFLWRKHIVYAGDYDDCYISVYLNLTKMQVSRQALSPFK